MIVNFFSREIEESKHKAVIPTYHVLETIFFGSITYSCNSSLVKFIYWILIYVNQARFYREERKETLPANRICHPKSQSKLAECFYQEAIMSVIYFYFALQKVP